MDPAAPSPFLEVPEAEWLCANGLAFAVFDSFPVSPGHVLVITRRVVPTFFECTVAERGVLMALVGEVKALLAELENLRGTPDSFRPDEPATASRHTRSVANSVPNLVSHLLTTNGFVSHFWHESEKQH